MAGGGGRVPFVSGPPFAIVSVGVGVGGVRTQLTHEVSQNNGALVRSLTRAV